MRKMLAAMVSARAGQKDLARAVAARARAEVTSNKILATELKPDDAYLQLIFGDSAAAARLLAEYLAQRPSRAALLSEHPRWKPLNANAAFKDILSRATLSK
jgi:hypothetical protein